MGLEIVLNAHFVITNFQFSQYSEVKRKALIGNMENGKQN